MLSTQALEPSGAMARLSRDPRHYQIAVLSLLLAIGMGYLGFPVRALDVATLLAATLFSQYVLGRARGVRFDWRSPMISALSLSLLLRSDQLWVLALGGVLAISSKFLIRFRGKHLFNPANFGLLVAILVTGRAWASPGQWGSAAILGLLFACLGSLVVHRAARSDVTWALLLAYSAVLFGRAAWLGDPWTIPLHTLENGALLLFAFFMISDPKTTPDSRSGRISYAVVVALAAATFQFVFFVPNGFLWALLLCCPLVPFIDRLVPAGRYHWPALPGVAAPRRLVASSPRKHEEYSMTRRHQRSTALNSGLPRAATATRASSVAGAAILLALAGLLSVPSAAEAFCGFYVAKADAKLFNRASQVVLARDGNRTVITMANDFQGDPTEFAVVVPVPTFLERGQIHVANQALIDHLDAYTSPRLVEYFDENPCRIPRPMATRSSAAPAELNDVERSLARQLGVTIEASYTVGEYDILILSAEESNGLETWLVENGYRIPEGASRVLGSYLKQGMRFFVAKVNLDQQAKLGFANLRPLQVAFESPKFMLPIRLGTVNADGPQELFVYTLTRKGRVETTNYRTVRLPTGMELPVFVKNDFDDFYRDMFEQQVEKDRMRAVYLEYAWDMGWCDPCAADPLSVVQLRELGAFWLADSGENRGSKSLARDAFVTRLHLRYDSEHFPEDLQFQETSDRGNFQGRYVLRHPWTGRDDSCAQAESYRRSLVARHEKEVTNLARLTGWSIESIRERMGLVGELDPPGEKKWWEKLWPGF